MINWLKKNKKRLSLRGIEQELDIPETTLSQVTRDKNPIPLPNKWVEPLRLLACQMNYEILEQTETVGASTNTDDPFIQMAKKPKDFKVTDVYSGEKPPLSKDTISKMVADSTKKIKTKKK